MQLPDETANGPKQSTRRDDEVAQLGELVTRLSRRLRRSSTIRLAPFGLSDGQARVLRMIGRSGSPLRMSEIASRIAIVPRSATTVVEGLEDKGLVAREIDTEDRRSILVRLTARGTRLIEELSRVRDEAAAKMFHQLERSDRVELLRLLVILDTTDGGERSAGASDDTDERAKAFDSKRRRR